MRKTLLFLALQLAVFAIAAPAFAHGGGGPDASNFKSVVRGISEVGAGGETDEPAELEGVQFRVLANDALLEVENRSGKELVIYGYSDEPYLRIGPDGVFRNLNSPASYINNERFGNVEVPENVSASAEPRWEKVAGEPKFAWHDHRIHWMAQALPGQVAANAGARTIKIFDWTVPFKIDDQSYAVNGTLNWVRPASPAPWLLGGLAATSLPLLVGLTKPPGEERKRMLKRAMAVVLGTLVVLDVIHSVDDILAVPATLGQNISASLQSALFIGLGAYGAVWAWRAGSGAWVGILLGAFGLALGIGASHLITLTSSQIASTLPEAFTRAVIAANVAVLVPAGFLAWRVHEPVVVESQSIKT
jgi:hypothetical protein